MTQAPEVLARHIKATRFVVADNTLGVSTEEAAAWLQADRTLTHVSIPNYVNIPPLADGTNGAMALAIALERSNNPNLIEATIAGSNRNGMLEELCRNNQEAAERLLQNAADPHHALSGKECEEIVNRLPAMLHLATTKGPLSSNCSMTGAHLTEVLARIHRHSAQHGIDIGPYLPSPATTVESCKETSRLGTAPARQVAIPQ